MATNKNALNAWRNKYVNPVTGGANSSAGETGLSAGGSALDAWKEKYVSPVTTPKETVPVTVEPVEVPSAEEIHTSPAVETDAGEERNWLDLQKDAFLYGAGKVGTGILGALEGANDFIGSAFYGAVGGLSDLVGADKLADFSKKKAASYLENSITDDLNQKLDEKFKPTGAMQTAGAINETVSGLLPSIAAGNVVGSAGTGLKAAEQATKGANVSKALFGLTAAGGSAGEAKKEGATLGQAMAYGTAAGLLETTIEGIAGGIPGMGTGKAGEIAAKLTSNPVVAKILDIVGEGGEEALSTFVTPYLKRAMYDENAQNATAEEIAQSAAMGMIASGVLQGGFELPGVIGSRIRNRQAGIIPGSGLDGTPAAQDGVIPVENRTATQTTPNATEQKTVHSAVKPALETIKVPVEFIEGIKEGFWSSDSYEQKASYNGVNFSYESQPLVSREENMREAYSAYLRAAKEAGKSVDSSTATQTTTSAEEQTATLPGVDTSGRFGAVEGEKNAPAKAEMEQIVSDSNIQRFRTVIDGVFTGANPSGSDIVVGDTPSILQQYGAPDLQLRVSQSTVRKIVYPEGYMGGKHNLGMSAMKQLPYQIADPVAILKSRSQPNSLVLLTEWKTQDGQDVIVPIHLNKQGAVEIGNAIASAYGTSHIETILGENDSNVLYTKNNEDIHQLLSNGLQLPEAMADDVLAKNTIPQNEAGVKNQYTQESAQVFNPGSGMENATAEDGVPAQSDYGSTDEGYWDSIMEEQKLPFSESDVDGYMEALLADVDQRLNRATQKGMPVTEEYEKPKKGKKAKRSKKSPTENERVKEIVLDPEVTGSKSITPEFAQALSSSGVSYNKDLARNLDAAGAGSVKLREDLRNLIERPFRAAGKSYANKTKAALNDLKKTMDALGIKKGSKESAAVQRFGEGQYQDEKGEVHEYTEAMLREEFPDTWQNIVKAAQYSRQIYDGYVDRINAVLEQIYPNALGKAMEDAEYQSAKAGLYTQMAEEQQQTYNSLQERLNEKKEQLGKSREGSQRYADIQNTIHRIEQQMENVKGKITSLREQVDVSNAKAAAIHARVASGEILRNKQLKKRTDYFHHFNEMAEGWAGLANILTTPTDIDSTLAGISDHTKPKTRWAGFMQGRKGGAYTEDAVGGLLEYIPQAEYKISFDPIIAENRNIIKTLAEETEDSRNANAFIEWMTDWTNDLAGKTNPFDRAVQKVVKRKGIAVAKWLSSRAKANAVVGNVRSATAQVFNLPNAVVYIKSPKAWKSGAMIYGRALGGDATAKSLFEESGFLSERYMDDAISQFDEGILKKPEKFANWMLTVGDKEVAKLIWASAYEQGRAQNVADPVEYADDITRRSVAGRGVGDVPLMQKAVVTQLFAPFQVEVNNTWQLMKEAGANKNWGGLLAMFIMSFLMNSITRELFGYDVAIDPFNAVIEGVQDWDEEKTIGGNVLGVAGRLGGELLSNVPYGAQVGSVMVSDEYDREKIFGDTDPSRFGTGNIGIDALADTLVSGWDAVSEGDITKFDLMTPLTNFILPYGGKQVGRVIEGAQDLGLIPVASKDGISRQPDAGSMSDTGRLRFAIDENNRADIAKLFAFGPFSTKGGIEYIEEGMLPLSEKRTAEAMAAAKRGVDLVDYMDAYHAAAKVYSTADKLAEVLEFAENDEIAKELFGIVLGTDTETDAGNPSQYAKMVAAMDEGMTAEEYVKYRQAINKLTTKSDKLESLQAAGFTAAEAERLLEQLG